MKFMYLGSLRKGGLYVISERADREAKKIQKLRKKAQYSEAAKQLYKIIELECAMILKTPNSAPKSMVKKYNQLVRNSDLPLPERAKLLLEEKKK